MSIHTKIFLWTVFVAATVVLMFWMNLVPVDDRIYFHDDLENQVTKNFYPTDLDAEGCFNKKIKQLAINILFDLGEDYDYGKNPFET